jgi:hypothetical protein
MKRYEISGGTGRDEFTVDVEPSEFGDSEIRLGVGLDHGDWPGAGVDLSVQEAREVITALTLAIAELEES